MSSNPEMIQACLPHVDPRFSPEKSRFRFKQVFQKRCGTALTNCVLEIGYFDALQCLFVSSRVYEDYLNPASGD